MTAWTATDGGLLISLRVTPKGGRNAIDGLLVGTDGRAMLSVRVSVPPTEGGANDAVISLLAKALGVARRDVKLLSGTTSRMKRLRVDGDPLVLTARLATLTGTGSA